MSGIKNTGILGLFSCLVIGVPLIAVTTLAQNPVPVTPVEPISPPLPEERSSPVASIIPNRGTVNIQLNNSTNTLVTYEVIGHTGQRQLNGEKNAKLTNIRLPVTITVIRPDNGFLKIIPVSSESGTLQITLEENSTFNNLQGVIRIQENGDVFLN